MMEIIKEIEIRNQKLIIKGKEFPNYTIKKYIGGGVNGIVYLAQHDYLLRDEAIKIWLHSTKDKRDKIKQGLTESRKLSKVNGNYSVQIYNVVIFENHVVASMEYFKGQTLINFIKDKEPRQICIILYTYLEAIEKTSAIDTYHGDAHPNNVLVRIETQNYQKKLVLKLCDFGTSFFSSKEFSFNRHWRIVKETILNCTRELKDFDIAVQMLKDFEEHINATQKEIIEEIKANKKTQFYDARIFTAPLRDFLEYILFVNTGLMKEQLY